MLPSLTYQQGCLGTITAIVHDIDVGGRQAGHQVGVVDLTRCDLLVQDFVYAPLAQLLAGLGGNTGTVDLAVVQDRNLVIPPMLRQVVAGDDALAIVAADHAEHVGAPLPR